MYVSSSYSSVQSFEAPEPFDEIRSLSDRKIEEKSEKLMSKGYFTVPISESSKAFLNKLERAGDGWRSDMNCKKKSLVGTSHEADLTTTANRIVKSIAADSGDLTVQECEVRRLKGKGASLWHQDKQPKKLVMLATIKGSGTDYVLPQVSADLFKKADNIGDIEMYPVPDAEVERHVKQAKNDRFYFFAARGLDDESIPKLVHRAPPEKGRSIFMARWK